MRTIKNYVNKKIEGDLKVIEMVSTLCVLSGLMLESLGSLSAFLVVMRRSQ